MTFPSALSISFSPTSVTGRKDCCHHLKFNHTHFCFHHLADVRVAEVHEEPSQNDNAIRTTINHRLLVPRGRLTICSVSQMLQYIYAPHQNHSISGDAKHILPLMGHATALSHSYFVSCMIMFKSPL